MTIETKLQIEALKLLGNFETVHAVPDPNNECFYIATDGYSAVRVSMYDFHLDMESLSPLPSLIAMFDSSKIGESEKLTDTNTLKISQKDTLHILKCEKFTTCINEKYYKKFIKNGCELYAESEKKIICFVIDGKIYAVVMPVTLPKEK